MCRQARWITGLAAAAVCALTGCSGPTPIGPVIVPAPPATGAPSPSVTSPVATPAPGTAAPSGAGAPTAHRITGDLCAAVDLTPIADLAAQPVSRGTGDHSDKSGYTVHTCQQVFRHGSVETSGFVTAMLFTGSDAAAQARARLDDTRANLPTGRVVEPVDLLTRSWGYATESAQARTWQLWALDGNLLLGVRVKATTNSPGGQEQLRAAAVATARATAARLR
ncbi:hypothetical protein F4553_001531 [Allocatelliglobosispora scoriae]|uniref:DUF3558 domain-containing protein n=1 Tax=Allocatelliglobosispora scoriae TaxID=643052 RepID=A0A841BN30_9ACTN|nr:hypothetical protein [Allocatelliglobosispora scoriae]MBB5868152.1 hypothetical protein [Allocatelliglobosispora scoriae]